MEFLIFGVFFFLILIPLVLGIVIPIMIKHRKVTGNVINYDSLMGKYVYKVCMSESEIIKKPPQLLFHINTTDPRQIFYPSGNFYIYS